MKWKGFGRKQALPYLELFRIFHGGNWKNHENPYLGQHAQAHAHAHTQTYSKRNFPLEKWK
jgi:hypothetical protein